MGRSVFSLCIRRPPLDAEGLPSAQYPCILRGGLRVVHMPGKPKRKKITGPDRQARVLSDLVPLSLRLLSSSVCFSHAQLFSILHQIRCVYFIPLDPRILNSSLFHIRFTSCRTLIYRTQASTGTGRKESSRAIMCV